MHGENNLNKATEMLKNNSVHFDELGILKGKDIEVEIVSSHYVDPKGERVRS